MRITELKILNAESPIGIGKRPYFSWRMESALTDTLQISYHLTVLDIHEKTMMDSGWITSRNNSYIPYIGLPLESATHYHVILEIKDNHGEFAKYETSFETGLLKAEDWNASWVAQSKKAGRHKPGFKNQQPSIYLRESFKIMKKVLSAKLYATAHGVYELYVNGIRQDDNFFSPEHTTYAKYLCYQTYDLASVIHVGVNIIGMHIGNGWFHSFGAKPNFRSDRLLAGIFQLQVIYEDGTSEIFSSSDKAVWTEGPAIADLWAGEFYNSEKEISEWSNENCSFDGWKPVKIMDYGIDNLVPQNTDRVRIIKEIPVKEVLHSPKGECILDFGQNMAGIVRISAPLKAGQVIRLAYCEVLDKEGNYYNNILHTTGVSKGIDQIDEYISDGTETPYTPHFTYHGFRYAAVTIDGESPTELNQDDFTALLLSTEKDNTGTFACSNEDLNQLYQNIRWSQYSNMLSIPTDCPQREKAGWTGDMMVYAKTAMQNEDCTLLFSRWLENMSLEQDSYGIVPMVVPEDGTYPSTGKLIMLSAGAKGKGTSSGWGDAAVSVPYDMYQITGNTEVLRRQYYCMRRWCDYIISRAKNYKPKKCTVPDQWEQYLWDTGYHYGEWLIPSQNKNGMDMKNLGAIMASSSCYTAPIFGWYSVKTFADIIDILADEYPDNALYATDAGKYRSIADHMKDAIQHAVIRDDGSMPSELMGAYVLPLCFELVPNEQKDAFTAHLIKIIEKNNYCMDTGFLATPYLLDALCKINRKDLAYKLLLQKENPSWLSEVRQGATTIWENCFGYDENGNPGQLSFNHYAFGCVGDWIFRNIGGIMPVSAGYYDVMIHPSYDIDLAWASRTFKTGNGVISVSWSREGEMISLNVEIPCNTTAVIVLPDGTTQKTGSGVYHYEKIRIQ